MKNKAFSCMLDENRNDELQTYKSVILRLKMIDHPKSREHKNTYLCGLWVTFILQYSKLNLRMLFGASQSLVSIFKCVASKKV